MKNTEKTRRHTKKPLKGSTTDLATSNPVFEDSIFPQIAQILANLGISS